MGTVTPITNRVEARPLPPERLHAADFGASGAIIGQSVEHLGEAGMSLAEARQHRDVVDATTAARDADNLATAERQTLYNDGESAFFNQQGRNALNAVPTLTAERQRIDREAAERLQGNPLAQHIYADIAARRRIVDDERINTHLRTQRTAYENSVDEDGMRTAVGAAVTAHDDPAEVTRNITTVQDIAERHARRMGLTGEDAIRTARGRATATLVGEVAERMRQRSPSEAQAFIIAHAEQMDPLDTTRLLGAVDDEAAAETANERVQPYLVGVGADEQPPAQRGNPGNVRPTPVPPTAAMHAAIAGQESGRRERDAQGRLITSSAGAQGQMQVMPTTNVDPGYGVRPAQDNSDAERSRVGRDYYDALLSHYNGNVTLALTAYNWGPGNVDAHIRTHGDPRRGQISDSAWLATVPNDEAQNYATAVLRRAGTAPSTSANSPASQSANYQGQEINLAATISRIDADTELSYPQKQALIAAASRVHSLGAQARAESDQRLADTAYTEMNRLGDNFTNYDQLPLTVRQQLGAVPRLEYQFRQIAESNLHEQQRIAAAGPPRYSQPFLDLLEASQGTPEERIAFMRQDLRSPALNIPNTERVELMRIQGGYRQQGEREAVAGANREAVNVDRVRTYVSRVAGPDAGFITGAHATATQNQNRILLTQRVVERVRVEQAQLHRQVNDEELMGIVASEVRPVSVVTRGRLYGESRTPVPGYLARPTAQGQADRYARTEVATPEGVPPADAQAIVTAYRRENNGAYPTDEMILDIYARRHGTR